MTDPIGDMVNRIKVAASRGLVSTLVPHSKLKEKIAELLVKEGYLSRMNTKGKHVKKYLDLELSYKGGKPHLHDAIRVSKPGKRVYVAVDEMKSVLQGKGISVVSTSKGLMSNKEARKAKIGGELLFTLW